MAQRDLGQPNGSEYSPGRCCNSAHSVLQNVCLEGGRGLITQGDHIDGLLRAFENTGYFSKRENFFLPAVLDDHAFKNQMRLLQEKKYSMYSNNKPVNFSGGLDVRAFILGVKNI